MSSAGIVRVVFVRRVLAGIAVCCVAWATAAGAQPRSRYTNDLGGATDVQEYLTRGLTVHLRARHAEMLACVGGTARPVTIRVATRARGRVRSVRVRIAGGELVPDAAACVERIVRAWHPPRTNGYDATISVRWPLASPRR